jgi:ankyrin repeat protein
MDAGVPKPDRTPALADQLPSRPISESRALDLPDPSVVRYAGDVDEQGLRAAIKGDSMHGLTFHLADMTDVNALMPSGESALHLAAAFDRPEMVEILVANGADLERRNRRDRTPLHMARGETVEILLRFGVDLGARDDLGATPLHRAGHEAAALLIAQGADIHARDRAGGTPLLRAVERGDDGLVRLLIDYGADVNAADSRRGATAVHRAVSRRDLVLIRLLLSRGAHVNARDRYGSTPLNWTESPLTGGGRPDTQAVVQLLLANGAH